MDDASEVSRIEALEKPLVALFAEVHAALGRLNRTAYDAEELAQLDTALEPPVRIAPAKAIAVLKALVGSTPADMMSLESFYGARMTDSLSVGDFIHSRLQALGVGYHDFWPYLRAKGWLRPEN